MDDIALSGGGLTREAIGEIISAIQELGLSVRHKKTSNSGARQQHELTGYDVTGPQPKVSKKKIQEVRTSVYQAVLAHRRGESVDIKLRSIRGSLSYLRQTNPGVVRRLIAQMEGAGIPW
jgi:hypothetical protein